MAGYSATVRNDMLTQLSNAVDGGTGAGTLTLYDGTQPATGGTATNALVTITLPDPAFNAPSNGTMSTASSVSGTVGTSGTATWARMSDSAGTFVADFSVGGTGSGADIELDNTSLVAGGTVTINSFTITEGNA